jgi:hypothetical protein
MLSFLSAIWVCCFVTGLLSPRYNCPRHRLFEVAPNQYTTRAPISASKETFSKLSQKGHLSVTFQEEITCPHSAAGLVVQRYIDEGTVDFQSAVVVDEP